MEIGEKVERIRMLEGKLLRECSKRNHKPQATQKQRYFAVNMLQKNLLK